MRNYILLFLVFGAFTVSSQTKEIYVNPAFSELTKTHEKLAVLPFKAIIKLRPKEMERMTPEQFSQLQKDEGIAVQSAILSYLLKRKEQHDFKISFQDMNTTNALLAKNNVDQSNIDTFTPKELAEILQVDGVVTGILMTDKPMSDGASLAMGVLVGFYGSTNSGKCTISINDGATGELLWKYDKTLARSLGSDTNTIINAIMRKASRQLPYIPED
jgi:hypothetical protein